MPYLLTYFLSVIFVSIAVISSDEPASLGEWAILPFFALFLALPIWGALWLSLKLLRFIPVVKDSDYVKAALEKETQAREIRKEKRAERKKQKLELKLQARAEREKRERAQNERIKAQSLREKTWGSGFQYTQQKAHIKRTPERVKNNFMRAFINR